MRRWMLMTWTAIAVLVLATTDVVAATALASETTAIVDVAWGWMRSSELWLGVGALGVTLATTNPTLLDFKNRLDPDDKIARIIELLNQKNEVLDDLTLLEGNELTGHVTTVRTGIPEPTWRKLYGGVQPTKSTTAQIRDAAGMSENYAEVDKALADLNGNAPAWHLSENLPILEGFNRKMARSLFYSNEVSEPEAFTGLAPRFNDGLGPENAENILDGGGVGADNTSVWLVVWGPNTVHGFYPKGSKAGLTVGPTKEVTIENVDGAGGRMEGYRTHYRWDLGLSVRDWRYVVRIANIDVSALTKDASAGADLIDLMTQALELVEDLNSGRPAFYANRTIRSFLRRQTVAKVVGSTLMMGEVAGKPALMFDSVPVRRVDALNSAEAAVSFV